MHLEEISKSSLFLSFYSFTPQESHPRKQSSFSLTVLGSPIQLWHFSPSRVAFKSFLNPWPCLLSLPAWVKVHQHLPSPWRYCSCSRLLAASHHSIICSLRRVSPALHTVLAQSHGHSDRSESWLLWSPAALSPTPTSSGVFTSTGILASLCQYLQQPRRPCHHQAFCHP